MGFLARKQEPTLEELAARVAALEAQVHALAGQSDRTSGGDDAEVDHLALARLHLERVKAIKFG